MAKKNFDVFLHSVNPPKPSPAEIEAMTRELHSTRPEQPRTRKPASARPAKPATPEPVTPAEPARRGRKPKVREEERMIRVSVDLPESVFIALTTQCVKSKTDKKTYVRMLVERDLKG
jgi:hypothetical protein